MIDKFTLDGCQIVRETDNAVLVECEETGQTAWIPISQIDSITRSPNKFCDSVTMSYWIAVEKGLA